MTSRQRTIVVLSLISGVLFGSAMGSELTIIEESGSVRATSAFLDVELANDQPQFVRLTVDSLGMGKFRSNGLRRPASPAHPALMQQTNAKIEYRTPDSPASAAPRWTIDLDAEHLTLISQWSEADPPEPIILNFDTGLCPVTLLGRMNQDGSVQLPALLHLPDQGTFRITAVGQEDVSLGYEHGIRIRLLPASATCPRLEYRWEVTAIHPHIEGMEGDSRFDGFRRNWLNILQLNPSRRVLSNHAMGDNCAFCLYEYADVARHTPSLAPGLSALDILRQSIDRYMEEGFTGYGMTGHKDFRGVPNGSPTFLDTYPSLLIAATDYVDGSDDTVWLERNYAALRNWTHLVLAMDRDGNGLVEYPLSGNSGSWTGKADERPSNWWDTIGFGHEDAYANALAYRALRGMTLLADRLSNADDAARFRSAADRLQSIYCDSFFNPATGVLAGWRSADGQLHDYYFTFVNGIAIHYGLVSRDKANAIMDRLLAKMREVGYLRFDLGLPGNLVPVPREDYFTDEKRWGGGPDGFQIYENGGATACFAYFTLAALYDLGRREEADRILFPMLDAFEKGSFQGRQANGMTNDWKTWDGTAQGYEGFLVDNYYALLAVLAREKRHQMPEATKANDW